ncbi:MAG: hypothetical protein IBGAMO2_570014 [Arenicellales bacterium IbO2]|nr:MAG: hypothetical protein IBGAMO2_570014 [Arenicellales bacterium IbO2]
MVNVSDRRPSAHIAQSVEHFLGKEEVTGSNPVVGSGRAKISRSVARGAADIVNRFDRD